MGRDLILFALGELKITNSGTLMTQTYGSRRKEKDPFTGVERVEFDEPIDFKLMLRYMPGNSTDACFNSPF